ncbi:peptide/nickel transport system substrate-binding protein [Arthrobacter woluwensis]|uniref:ABC transporter family substrate-binding protein n=1 Tax=Arthrobacter woluwensis TaxID=156980 RepID=UPI002785A400|nr:ABC transporter family substrate-binding protein [Arthrobacter woluwensis]MDQ0710315.1 peptide/nickel transport system substrate-binding protein [Arthrobacter woluwensis]
MKKKVTLGVATLAAVTLALTACGGGTAKGPESAKAEGSGSDVSKLIQTNPKDVKDLDQGGTLTLELGNIGPDFNGFGNSGNSSDNTALMGPINQAFYYGCWKTTAVGDFELDKDFCEDFKSEVKDGKQILNIKINDKATWNDGTPIDWKTFENTWKVLNGTNKDYDIVDSGSYKYIESVTRGATDKDVVVTVKQPVYPLASFFAGIVHPKVNTPEIFNKGFNNNMHPEWMAGPFKVEKFDSAALTVSMVKNEKWWGNKPVLDKVVFRQMEDSATIAAFKNGEIDATGGRTVGRYKQLEGTKDTDIRRGQRLFAGGLNVNAKRPGVQDVAVRKAIFTAVDREAIRKVRFNGLNWEEPNSGTMMLMPFSKYYQDNWPVQEQGADAAKKVLSDAGYKPNAKGIMEKNGKPVTFKITNFGDDPTVLASVQTLQKQLQAAGMDVGIDQRGSAEFGKIVGDREFDVTMSGYTVGSDATQAVGQYYSTESDRNGLGNADLDKRIAALQSEADDAKRNKEALDVEKDYAKQYFTLGPVLNGPQIEFVKKGLANYGPTLFANQATDTHVPDWTTVGWEKGSTHK